MKNTFCSVILVSLISILTVSCASTPVSEGKPARLDVLPNSKLMLDGNNITVETIGKDLKSAGYSYRSAIEVHHSSALVPAQRLMLSKALAQAGFRRFVFIGPRKATATVTADTPLTKSTPPAPVKTQLR